MDRYQKALLAHLKETAPLAQGYPVDSIYFGGGTPSYYGAKRIKELLAHLSKLFQVEKDAEITVECNPDSVDLKSLRILRKAGVNRLSMGMQSARRGSCGPSTASTPPSRPTRRWRRPGRPSSPTCLWT